MSNIYLPVKILLHLTREHKMFVNSQDGNIRFLGHFGTSNIEWNEGFPRREVILPQGLGFTITCLRLDSNFPSGIVNIKVPVQGKTKEIKVGCWLTLEQLRSLDFVELLESIPEEKDIPPKDRFSRIIKEGKQ